jgi:hypothetical protein
VPVASFPRRRRSRAALRAVAACTCASAATLAWSSRPRGDAARPVEGLGDSFFHAGEVVLDVRQAGGQLPALADLHLNPNGDLTWHPRIHFATHMRLNAHPTLTHACPPGRGIKRSTLWAISFRQWP